MARWIYGLVLAVASCGSPTTPGPSATTKPEPAAYMPEHGLPGSVQVAFALRQRSQGAQPGGFFGMPWPSELWRLPDGHLDFRGFPTSNSFLFGNTIAEAVKEIDAFSVSPTIYFHFSGPVDPARLPKPLATTTPESPLALIDVDPSSPTRGQRVPLVFRYYAEGQRHVPQDTLAVRPLTGFVLRPHTLYAAVLLRRLADPPLGTTSDFERTKWTSPPRQRVARRARALHAPVMAELERLGMARVDIAALAVFRTQRPHAVFSQLFEVATRLPAAHLPRILRAEWLDERTSPQTPYRVIRGYYCTPNFQTNIDEAPFTERGGTLRFGPEGQPQVQAVPKDSPYRTDECGELLRARFVLTVPRGEIPDDGWPLVVVTHGTTGDAFDFVGDDAIAAWAAREGIAAVSTDQPLHGGRDPIGARPGSRKPFTFKLAGIPIRMPIEGYGSELAFYYPLRLPVFRDNLRQAAIDAVLLASVMLVTDFAATQPARGAPLLTSQAGRTAPRFDARKLMLVGHSQGSQSAAVHAAIDPRVRGVVLSGCGGDLRLSFARRRDTNAQVVVEMLLGLAPNELDEFHPLLALAQTVLDPVDPQSYARFYYEPLPGRRPQNVLHFGGVTDTMTIPETSEALAVALRAQPLEPLLRPAPGLSLLALKPARSVRGNAASGDATIAFAQLAATQGEDGHFVMFAEPDGAHLVRQFLGSLARGTAPPEVGPRRAAR